jgi:nucleotide-binding universal stress UspA family protein
MIVVGVDGSETSRSAFAWALAEASVRSDNLRVVCAWDIGPSTYTAMGFGPVPAGVLRTYERAAEQTVARMLESYAHAVDGIAVERSIVHGGPADILIEAAKDAALLVVGSHGHGPAAALFLGSVSMRCAQLASCPVVIVRHDVALAKAA